MTPQTTRFNPLPHSLYSHKAPQHYPSRISTKAVDTFSRFGRNTVPSNTLFMTNCTPTDLADFKTLASRIFNSEPKTNNPLERITRIFNAKSRKELDLITDELTGAYYKAVLAHPKGRIVIIKDKDQVIGGMVLSPFSGYTWEATEFTGKGWITDFAIDERYRRKGLGKKLLTKAVDYAKQLGYTELYLDTEKENVKAQRLYTKHGGFEKCSIKDTWMSDELKEAWSTPSHKNEYFVAKLNRSH